MNSTSIPPDTTTIVKTDFFKSDTGPYCTTNIYLIVQFYWEVIFITDLLISLVASLGQANPSYIICVTRVKQPHCTLCLIAHDSLKC